MFQGASEADLVKNKVEEQAKRCVILAVKVPTVINFEEVLDLDAIKHLKLVHTYSILPYLILEKKGSI
jgi:hypothetical protein